VHRLLGTKLTRLVIIIAVLSPVATAITSLPAHASTPEISLLKKCNNAADITDNGRDVWLLCQGLSASLSNIIEIDVNTGKVVADIASPSGIQIPDEITSNDDYVWIKNNVGSGSDIAQFATPSGRLVRILSFPAIPATQPLAIAASPSSLWITDQGERHLVQVSASTGQVTHVGASDEFGMVSSSIATSGNYVWVLDGKQTGPSKYIYTVTQFRASGTVVRVITLSTYNAQTGHSVGVLALPDSLSATPSGVWVDSSGTDAIEINAATGRVIRNFKNLPSFGQKNGPHLLVVSGSQLWVAAYEPALFEFNTNTGHVTNTSTSSGTFYESGYYGIAADSKYVWVVNSSFGQLAQFRRSNDSLVREYS
jgi:hypothetical protein